MTPQQSALPSFVTPHVLVPSPPTAAHTSPGFREGTLVAFDEESPKQMIDPELVRPHEWDLPTATSTHDSNKERAGT